MIEIEKVLNKKYSKILLRYEEEILELINKDRITKNKEFINCDMYIYSKNEYILKKHKELSDFNSKNQIELMIKINKLNNPKYKDSNEVQENKNKCLKESVMAKHYRQKSLEISKR